MLPPLSLPSQQVALISLFPDCAAPSCRIPVEHPGQVCPGCQEEFGPYLRPAGELLADGQQPAAGCAGPAVEWRRNQTCWACEERHTCRRDPDHPQRWICVNCMTFT